MPSERGPTIAVGGVGRDYNPRMPDSVTHRVFTLDEARALLPTVKRLTAEAVRETELIAEALREVSEEHPRHAALEADLQQVLASWAESLTALHVEAKGLWLVDFDNGDGYYCWSYPEDTVGHYHGYEEGFAGRMKIV